MPRHDRRATLRSMEALVAMLLLPLLMVAPLAEAVERRDERRRARAAARAWAKTWLQLYGRAPASGLTNLSTKRSAVPRLPASCAARGIAFQSRGSSGLRRNSADWTF